jgi:LysM repeat protein
MKKFLSILLTFVITILSACNAVGQNQPETTPEPTPILCLRFVVEAEISCNSIDENTVIVAASGDESVELVDGDLSITIEGRTQIQQSESELTINAISGNAVVTVDETTRVLRGRQGITLQIVDGVVQAPEGFAESIEDSQLTQIANDIESLALPTDERTVEATEPAVESTDEATEEATEEASATSSAPVIFDIADDCEPHRSWNERYIVEAGDVLEFIARDFGLEIEEIAIANCLSNPGLIYVGQVLRVPIVLPTLTPTTILFQADLSTIEQGECTTIRWSIVGAPQVFFDDETTTRTNIRRVCPDETTTYTLRVLMRSDSEFIREVTVTVNDGD